MNKDDRFVNPTIESLDKLCDDMRDDMSEFFRLSYKLYPSHPIFDDDWMEQFLEEEMIENKIDRLEGEINE